MDTKRSHTKDETFLKDYIGVIQAKLSKFVAKILCKNLVVFINALMMSLAIFSEPASANPQGGQVASGNVTIQQAPNSTLINQSSQKAIINWKSFNIGAGEKTHFQQPNGGIALNRINPTQSASQIYGQLTATGKIILINSAGIYFGRSAYVNVGGLIATTANITNQDFLKGNYHFVQDPAYAGSIINEGTIIAANNGLVALIGSNVSNTGVIEANLGQIVLASGSAFTMTFAGNEMISFSVDEKLLNTGVDENGKPLRNGVSNTGKLVANGGRILVAAQAARGVLDNAINMQGVAVAKSVGIKNGVIILSGGAEGIVKVSGKLIASGRHAGNKGGIVRVTGQSVVMNDSAMIDVSGDVGGGTVLLGGDYQGKNISIQNAEHLYVGPQTKIFADAMTQGNGGKIILWSDKSTRFYGAISAKGGAQSGNGGFIEVSGKDSLVFDGKVDTNAVYGQLGTLLLDPKFIEIKTVGGSGYSNGVNNLFANDAAGTDILTPASINAANANIILQANTDVTFTDALALTNNTRTLTVQAGRSILINNTISTTNGAITMTANDGTAQSANRDVGAGAITMASGTSLSSGGAAISLSIGASTTAPFSPGDMTLYGLTTTGNTNISVTTPGAISLNGAISSGSGTTTLNANTDGSGTDSITQNAAGTITTTNATAAAVTMNVNSAAGGTGGINLGANITTGSGGRITLATNTGANATGGSISQSAGTLSVGAGSFVFSVPTASASGIGASATPIATTSTGTLTLTAGSGGAFVTNTGNLILAAPTLNANSPLSVISSGTLTLPAAAISTGTGNLTLRSNGGTLTTAGSLTTTNGLLTLVGSTGLTLSNALQTGSGDISLSTTTSGGITQNAGGSITSTSGNLVMSARDAVTLAAAINQGSGTVAINANTDAAGANNFAMNAGSSITTTNTTSNAVAITANAGGAGTGTISLRSIATGSGGTISITNNGANVASAITQIAATALNVGASGVINLAVLATGTNAIGAVVTNILTTAASGVLNLVLGSGGAFVTNTGDLTLSTPTVTAANYPLSVISTGTLTLPAANLSTGTGNLTFRSNGGSLTTNGNLTTGTGTLTLVGATGLTIGHVLTSGTGPIGLSTTTSGDVTLNSSGSILSTSGTLTLSALDNVVLSGVINEGSGLVGINANQDGSGSQGLTMNVGSSVTTTNATATAVGVTVNTAGGGSGGAQLTSIKTGNGGTLTVSTAPGANTTGGSITQLSGGLLDTNATGATALGTIVLTTPTGNASGIGTAVNNIQTRAGALITLLTGSGGAFITNTGNASGYNGSLALGAATITGPLSVTASGSITQSGATVLTITGTPTFTLTTPATDILLGNANAFTTTPVFTNNGNIRDLTLRRTLAGAVVPILPSGLRNLTLTFNNAAMALPGVTLTGSLTATANGAITQTGTLIVPVTTTLAAGSANNITLNNAANNFGTVAITNGNNVSLTDLNALVLGASTVSGTLDVTTNGALTQSGTLLVTGLTTLTAGAANSITLSTATNDFSTVKVISGNNVNLRDTNSLILDAITAAGTLTVTTNGALTQSGIITATGATTLAVGAANNITLNNASNNFSTVGTTTGNNVVLTDINGIILSASTISGTLDVTAGGTISQSGILTIAGTPTFTVTTPLSDILLATFANVFTITPVFTNNGNIRDLGLRRSLASATIPVLPTGMRNLTLIFDNAAMTLPALTLTGTLTTTANGAITQSGALVVPGITTLASGAANNITLNNPTNDFSNVTITNGNNVTLVDANALVLGASTVSGTLDVTTNGALTQSGTLVVTGLTTLTAGAANSITLNTATNNFSTVKVISAANVNLRDTNALILNAVTAGGTLTVQTNGALTQSGAITATGLTTLIAGAANNITLNNTSNDFSTVSVTSGNNVNLVDTNALALSTSAVSGTFDVTAGGSITQSGVTALTITGAPTFTVTAPASDILLGNANAFTITPVFTNNGNIRDLTLRNTLASALVPSLPTGLRNVTLTFNAAAMVLPSVSLTGNLSATATGAITQTGSIAGTALIAKTLNTAGAAITLTNAGNDFTSIDLRARNVGDTANAPGIISYTDATGFDIATIGTTSSLNLISSGAITQSGALTITGTTTITAGSSNNITLTNAANNFTNLAINSGGDVNITDVNAINLNASTLSGNFTLNTNGTITQSGVLAVNGAGKTATFSAGAANNITLTNANNDFTSLAIASGNDVSITDVNAINLAASTIAGNFILNTSGAITQSGALAVNGAGKTATFTASAGNNITLTNPNNDFTNLAIVSGNDVSITDVSAINLAASTISGNFALSTNGDVTQSGALLVNGLGKTATFLVGSHTITLTNAGNDFTNLAIVSGDVNITDTNTINLAASAIAGNFTLNTSGAITQSGAVVVSNVGATTTLTVGAGNNITLTNASNDFTNLAINSGNDVSITDANAISLSASTISGNFVLNTSGDVTQSGTIIANGLNKTATFDAGNTGNITLNTASNDFSTVTITNGLSGTFRDVNDLTLGAVSVGQNFAATVGGSLTTTGLIQTDGGNVNLATINAGTLTIGASGIKTSLNGISQGGAITITAANSSNLNPVIFVNGVLDTRGGTGGVLSVGGSVQLNQAPATGAGNITINGNGNALVLGNLTFIVPTIFTTADVDIIINGLITSTGNGSNLSFIADNNNNGTGGVRVTSTGAVNSSGNLLLQGSDLFVNPGISVGLLTGSSLIAAGTISLLGNVGNSDINVNGSVQSTGLNQAVTITPAGTGSVQLGANVTTNGGAINLNNTVILGANVTLASSGGSINIPGAITGVSHTLTLAAGSGTDISLINANNQFGTVTITSGNNVQLVDLNGFDLGASVISGDLTVNTSGLVTQSGALSVVNGTATFGAGDTNNITLTNSGNDFRTIAVTSGNNVSITDMNALDLGASTVSNALVVNATGAITQSGAFSANSINTIATFIAGAANNITLTNPNNDFANLAIVSGNDVSITDVNAINLAASFISGNFALNTSGNITQSGALSVNGAGKTATFAAGTNNITLTTPNNDFTNLAIVSSNDVSITDTNAINLAASTISGNFTLSASGDITQSGALSINGIGKSATFATGGANNITLTNANNDFTTLAINNGNDASITDVNALNLGAISVGGIMNVLAGGNITQSGAISGAILTTRSAGGTVLNLNNTVTAFNATNNGSGSIQFVNTANPLNITGIMQNSIGNVMVTNTGALTTSGLIIANGGNVSLTTLSPDSNARLLTVNAGIQTNGGAIDLEAANNGSGSAAALVVNNTLTTTPGSGGILTIEGGLALNASPNLGMGNITLNGHGLDVILGTLNLTSSTTFSLIRFITVNGTLTSSAGSNLILQGDRNNSGVGGVLVTGTGSINSGGNLTLIGSNLSGLLGADAAAGIQVVSGGSLQAAGSITLLENTGNSNIDINGVVQASGANNINITPAGTGVINLGANVLSQAGIISFNGPVVLGTDVTLTANGITFANGISGGNNLSLIGQPGNNNFRLIGPLALNNIIITGSVDGNNLLAVNSGSFENWFITGVNQGNVGVSGVVGNFSFANMQNLTGGNNGNDFNFNDGASVSGLIDGSNLASTNTINYSLYATSIKVLLANLFYSGDTQNNSGAFITHFLNINSLVGTNEGNSVLQLPDKFSTITFTGPAAGYVNDPLYFRQFGKFVTPNSSDQVVFVAPGVFDLATSLLAVNGTSVPIAGFNPANFSGNITFINGPIPPTPLNVIPNNIVNVMTRQTADVVNMLEIQDLSIAIIAESVGVDAGNRIIGKVDGNAKDFTKGYYSNVGAYGNAIRQSLQTNPTIGSVAFKFFMENAYYFRELLLFLLLALGAVMVLIKQMKKEKLIRLSEILVNRIGKDLPTVSFKLRTALGIISGFAGLMYRNEVGQVSAKQKEFLGDIITESNNILSALTRIEIGKIPLDKKIARLSFEVRESLNNIIGFANLMYHNNVGNISTRQKEFLGNIMIGSNNILRAITAE